MSLTGTGVANIPVNFTKSMLADAPLDRPTKLQFGPDGRLYVAQQNGLIRIYTIVKDGPNDYRVTSQQQVTLIQNMPNHDDNGTLNTTGNQPAGHRHLGDRYGAEPSNLLSTPAIRESAAGAIA